MKQFIGANDGSGSDELIGNIAQPKGMRIALRILYTSSTMVRVRQLSRIV